MRNTFVERMRGALPGAILAAAGVLALALAGCRGESAPPPPTFTLVVPLATVEPGGETVCAAGSSEDFRRAQEEAAFSVYCPTALPAGFKLGKMEVEPADEGTSAIRADKLSAVFERADPPASLSLLQGKLSLEELAEFRDRDSQLSGATAYGDFEAFFFPDIVLGRSADGFSHRITVEGLTQEELVEIAAGMRPVAP